MARWKKILITIGVLILTSVVRTLIATKVTLGALPTVLITIPFFACFAWCFKDSVQSSEKKEKSSDKPKMQVPETRWQFRIKFEDGTHQKKQVTLSEKDYKRICDIFDEEIPLNGSTDLEGILQSVKKQLEEKLGRKITSIGFCDENYD